MIYLDWAATAIPYVDEIEAAYQEAAAAFANPSAQHQLGKDARALLENARSRCAAMLKVPAGSLYFTSGASESNSLVLLSLLMRPVAGSLVISGIEHPSVREQTAVLERCGWTVLTVRPDKTGHISPAAVLDVLREDTALVAIMGVNNEIGAVQPVQEIAAALKTHSAGKRSIHFHVDMVQSIGKLPIADTGLGSTHSASMSAHKIGGPRGIGLLYLRQPITSALRGGGQEGGIRPGTENVAGACAFARCLEHTYTDFEQKYQRAGELSHYLIALLQPLPAFSLIPASRMAAGRTPQDAATASFPLFSPWIIQMSFKAIPAEIMTRCLSDRGIFISAGSACSAKKKNRPILSALSIAPDIAQNAVRISIGPATEKKDLEDFADAVKDILKDFH